MPNAGYYFMDLMRRMTTEGHTGSQDVIGSADPLATDPSLPCAVILVPLPRYPVLRHIISVVAKPRVAQVGMNPPAGMGAAVVLVSLGVVLRPAMGRPLMIIGMGTLGPRPTHFLLDAAATRTTMIEELCTRWLVTVFSMGALATALLLAPTGTCRGEDLPSGCICRTSGLEEATIASRLSIVPECGRLPTISRPLDMSTTYTRGLWVEFEGGLKLWCSRLGRSAGRSTRGRLRRGEFEGWMLSLGPNTAVSTALGPEWRPAWRRATRTSSGRSTTTARGLPSAGGARTGRRRYPLPLDWTLSVHVSPRGPAGLLSVPTLGTPLHRALTLRMRLKESLCMVCLRRLLARVAS